MDYKEILKGIVDIINTTEKSDIGFANICTYIGENCPELKESEDERVRKELIKHLKELSDWKEDEVIPVKNPSYYQQWASWLEKQGDKCLVNFDEAEKEKYDFVSGQFIECRKSFNEFKEDNSYWLEYIGDDNYIGRSDNILNQKFHITPRQLFTLFTWQHRPKEDCNVNDEANAPTGYGKYVDECLNEAAKHFFSDGEDAYSVADLFYAGVRCGKSWLEKQTEQKPADSYCQENCKGFQETGKCFTDGMCNAKREAEQKPEENKGNIGGISSNWSEEDSFRTETLISVIKSGGSIRPELRNEFVNWLKSLRPQKCLIPSEEEIEKAAQEWDSKANFNPFYMTMENDKPTGVKQSITTHKESFKAGVNWILKSLNS